MAETLTEPEAKDSADNAALPANDATEVSDENNEMNDERIPTQLEICTDDVDATSQSVSRSSPVNEDRSTSLEDRVNELEEKLATLSLLLSQQRRRGASPPLQVTPPLSPSAASDTQTSHPALDSPASLRPSPISDRKRNLSFKILHGDSSSSTEILESSQNAIFLPQSETLRPKPRLTGSERIANFLNQQYPSIVKEEENMKEAENSTSKRGDKKDIKNKWLDYLNSFQESNYDVDLQMEEFVKIPAAVEALLGFGFWICVDSFLYILTVLPIRFLWSLLLLMRYMFIWAFRKEVPDGPFRFHRRHSYQLIQVTIIYTIYRFVLLPVSIGKLYHWIRGQAMIKLYVVIAMIEVFDRLLSSLGQDCLESLYWNATRRPRSSRLLVAVAVVLVYTTVHSFLLFVHVATLNVAMNSDDQALLSLLIGGNFAEIKSTVFKKYNKATLFKITASDICERFKLALFLTLVLSLNMSQGMDRTMVMNYVHMCGIVWAAEWLADWVKHSFITKFNYISSGIYPEYGLLLAGDFNGIGHEGVNMDHSHAVVKRLGFAQMPLVCVMFRYLKEAYKYATYDSQPSTWIVAIGLIAFWFMLLVGKQVLGSSLSRIANGKLKEAPEFSSNNAKVAMKKTT
eukprot:scaffold22589_cov138-Cylindrotheca_fusiformis.AAC.47